jgi:hypothetical protein
LKTLTANSATPPSQSSPASACPSANAGTTTLPTIAPTTKAVPTTSAPKKTLPATATAKMRGSSRIARHSTCMPRASTSRPVFPATRQPSRP